MSLSRRMSVIESDSFAVRFESDLRISAGIMLSKSDSVRVRFALGKLLRGGASEAELAPAAKNRTGTNSYRVRSDSRVPRALARWVSVSTLQNMGTNDRPQRTGTPMDPRLAEQLRARVRERGAAPVAAETRLSPAALAGACAGAHVSPSTAARVRIYLEHGGALPASAQLTSGDVE